MRLSRIIILRQEIDSSILNSLAFAFSIISGFSTLPSTRRMMELFHRGNFAEEKTRWRLINSLESRTQARSPGVESQSRIERVRNNGRSCYARRSCGRCPDYKRIAFFSSLSLSLPSPLPPPLLPRSRESKGVGRGIGRRGGVTLFGAKQTKRKRFVRSKISPRAFTRLAFLIDYPSLPFTLPLKGREEGKWWLVFSPTIMRSESSPFSIVFLFHFQ